MLIGYVKRRSVRFIQGIDRNDQNPLHESWPKRQAIIEYEWGRRHEDFQENGVIYVYGPLQNREAVTKNSETTSVK